MKKRIITGVLSLLLGLTSVYAQQLNMADTLPFDPEMKVGKLKNGLTYYLKHNESQKGLADFYILHNVGSIQEEDSQDGLAHFLEHMAFNGTKNFPGKSMISWLESVGLQFGTNINAATGMEKTYYMLSQVPLRRETVLDSTLLVLHDWSHFISLKDEEIDKERGVIIEERRQRNNAKFRASRKAAPIYYNGTRYADRDMLGSEEFLKTFPSESLREYYKRWYRPDLQAVIIVGDIDVAQVEEKLKNIMADIPAPVNPEPKTIIPIPGNAEPLMTVVTDPELEEESVSLYIKRDALPVEYNNRVGIYKMDLLLSAALSMANSRLAEMAENVAPFRSAQFYNSQVSISTEAVGFDVLSAKGNVLLAFAAAYTELERIRRHGFTTSELENFKTNTLRGVKYAYENANQRDNESYVWDCINNYTENTPILSAKHEWAVVSLLVSQMTLEEVNGLLSTLLTQTNNVIVSTIPEEAGAVIPTTDQLGAIMNNVRGMELKPYEPKVINKPLISDVDAITSGKVVETKEGVYGSTEWILSNGIKVLVKPTNYSPSQVTMSAYADGGISMVDDADYFTAQNLIPLVNMSGLGDFNTIDLKKVIGTKVAMATPTISRFSTGISGSAAKSDLETMLQLTHLYFTKPKLSRDKFDGMMQTSRRTIEASKNSAEYMMYEKMNVAIYGEENNVRTQPPTLNTLDAIDFDKMEGIYNKFFCDAAGNYTFYFLGDIDQNKLKPLVEKYLGSLPTGKQKLAWKDDHVRAHKGESSVRFEVPMQIPQSTVSYNYTGDIVYNQENSLLIAMLTACLQTRYHEKIREDKGGTYGVTVSGYLDRQPIPTYSMSVSFQTNPEMVDELAAIVDVELAKMAEFGPDRAEVDKNLSFWLKARPDAMKSNEPWLTLMENYETWGEDWNTDYETMVNSITPERVRDFAQKIVNDGNVVKVIMDPVK
ncbi:M16 family metallopeptidase [Thalassobellus citreus]|uniref:M16 family metallopeptidase n=1 Tax=Thalassobellus citreus TaxID=3367752 RepID=UPI0037AF0686